MRATDAEVVLAALRDLPHRWHTTWEIERHCGAGNGPTVRGLHALHDADLVEFNYTNNRWRLMPTPPADQLALGEG